MGKLLRWLVTFNLKKLLTWLDKYLLEIGVAFLLFFIPLYPKFPLFDIQHTWVYIRLEDLMVALVVGIWLIQLARRKVSFKTPLAGPIFLYWFVGALSLVHAVFILSPQLPHLFPHLALFHYLRRLEYMVLFFVAAATVKDLRVVKRYLGVMALTLLGVCLYGFGQKFLGWPAFLTMNEEFAKGLPLYLPPTARMTSTFAGHYDLAAFLVLMIALWGSLIFGFKNWLIKILIFFLALASFILLLFTASRISFAVYLVVIVYVLLLQKRKWLIIPVVILSLFLSRQVTSSSERFSKTFRVQRVVYDTRTGRPIATVEEFFATPTPTPVAIAVVKEPPPASEESLPLGSGFLSLEGLTEEEARAQIMRRPIFTRHLETATLSSQMATISGEFLIKRAIVYDISFTTRFQAEWPRAMEAFKRNIFLGSGFSSISLATDNDYLRFLGESGILGLFAFLGILGTFGLLAKQALRKITAPLARSVLIGTLAGVLGLLLNAVLIDVFEASKVAYSLWLLLGMTVGLVQFLLPQRESLSKEVLAVIRSPLTTIFLLTILAGLVFGTGIKNYFTGDDFTWLRWAFTAKASHIPQFFLSAKGFFYRPLAKLYFYEISPFLGLRPHGYHLVDLLVHLGCAVAAYCLVLLLTKKNFVASLAAVLFLIHPINAESVFWISTTSHLFASFFYLWGVVAYLFWRKTRQGRRWLFYLLSLLVFILGLLSHERMVTFPLIIFLYDLIFFQFARAKKWTTKVATHLPFWFLTSLYLWLRNVLAQAHGLSGDYRYNLKNFVFNLVGNTLGYLGELVAGDHFLPWYDWSRIYWRSHKPIALGMLIVGALAMVFLWRKFDLGQRFRKRESKLVIFSLVWFFVLLLPFLGLGNMAERYVYPAHLGFFLVLALVLEWLYFKIVRIRPRLAWLTVGVIIIGISSFYLWETEKTKRDWYQAGETANTVLLTLATNYNEFPFGTQLYFVNLPLRYRRAWVFPVGLKDGLWFIYRDDNLLVDQTTDLEESLDWAEKKDYAHVFIYENGELKEARRK